MQQVAAGDALYGLSTMMVLSTGNKQGERFHGDQVIGEFMLTHSNMTIRADTREFAINTSHMRYGSLC